MYVKSKRTSFRDGHAPSTPPPPPTPPCPLRPQVYEREKAIRKAHEEAEAARLAEEAAEALRAERVAMGLPPEEPQQVEVLVVDDEEDGAEPGARSLLCFQARHRTFAGALRSRACFQEATVARCPLGVGEDEGSRSHQTTRLTHPMNPMQNESCSILFCPERRRNPGTRVVCARSRALP